VVGMVFFGFIAFMCLVRELLNDVSMDTNMDVTHAELILKHYLTNTKVRQKP